MLFENSMASKRALSEDTIIIKQTQEKKLRSDESRICVQGRGGGLSKSFVL
jgi:hypothetical protein